MTPSPFQMLLLLLVLSTCVLQQQVHALSQVFDQDFSYMKVVYNATDLSFTETYDYVVVGGGTTGCSLAATLSEQHSVLLLERGKPPLSHPYLLAPLNLSSLNISQYTMIGQTFLTEEGIPVGSSMVLGGASLLSTSAYSRASPEFFASSSDSVQWDMGLVERAYRWVERNLVSAPGPLDYWQSTAREAFVDAGIVPDNGFTLNYRLGTQISGTINDRFERKRGADQLLNKGNFLNLRVGVEATAKRLLFSADDSKDGVPKASGVIYTDLYGYSHRAFARREVILSANAFESPKLMLLSGIGPEPYLSSQHIRVVHPQPSIGNFMNDNPRITAYIIPPFPLNSSSEREQVVGITKDYAVTASSVSFLFSPSPLPFSYFPQNARSVRLRLSVISGTLAQPQSRGTLRLGSPNNITVPPKVRFNYFSDPEDLSNCVSVARKIAEILNTTSISRLRYEDLQGGTGLTFFGATYPTDYASGDALFEDYCRNTFSTSSNYVGGCVVGKVVDGHFRVLGIRSLRVVDSSAFAVSSGPIPLGTGMMLGRYVGKQILQETKDSRH